MAHEKLKPQLDYLTDAGHMLRIAAPETSAYIMNLRRQVMAANGVAAPDSEREHVCTACGNILLPGRDDAIEIQPRTTRRGATRPARRPRKKDTKASSSSRAGPTKVVTCGLCSRETRIPLPAPPAPRRATGSSAQQPSEQTTKALERPRDEPSALEKPRGKKLSASASSRKRAKSRKAGLQSLLAGQAGSTPSRGLSLSDFLQK